MLTTQTLTTTQVAKRLGVNYRTVHRMVARGELTPLIKLPGKTGHYLFAESEITRYEQAT